MFLDVYLLKSFNSVTNRLQDRFVSEEVINKQATVYQHKICGTRKTLSSELLILNYYIGILQGVYSYNVAKYKRQCYEKRGIWYDGKTK